MPRFRSKQFFFIKKEISKEKHITQRDPPPNVESHKIDFVLALENNCMLYLQHKNRVYLQVVLVKFDTAGLSLLEYSVTIGLMDSRNIQN